MVSISQTSNHRNFRQKPLHTWWPRSARVHSLPSTLCARWSLPAVPRPCTASTSALPTPSLWTHRLPEISSAHGDSVTSWCSALSTVLESFGPIPSPDLSHSSHRDSSCITASPIWALWWQQASWLPSPIEDSQAIGTTVSDGASQRISLREENTTIPANSRMPQSGVGSSLPRTEGKHIHSQAIAVSLFKLI